MGPIVDIIKPLASGDGQNAQFFTVDNMAASPPSVPLYDASCSGPPANTPVLFNAVGNCRFQPKDIIRLLSFGVILPYQFTLGAMEAFLELKWWNTSGLVTVPVAGFGSNGFISLPFENSEFSVDMLLEWPNLLAGTGGGASISARVIPVHGSSFPVDVSMVGVPSSLNGLVLPVLPFFKVLHNLSMV